MNLLNLIESQTTGYDNLRALMQAVQNSQDAVLTVGGEPITLEYPEARYLFGRYKAYRKNNRQEEFINDLGDPVRFDLHMKELRKLIDKQRNFRGSVPGERSLEEAENIAGPTTAANVGRANWDRMFKAWNDGRPYAELEFPGVNPLTVYRTQMHGIYEYMRPMPEADKVKIVETVFADKIDLVEFIETIRGKGLIPAKVPAPTPTDTQTSTLPGIPPVQEADQKKKLEASELDRTTAVNPKVARAFQMAKARQPASKSDIEAFVRDELDQAEDLTQKISKLEQDNERQEQEITQLATVVKQQDQAIDDLKQPEKTKAVEPGRYTEPEKAKDEPEEKPKAEPKEKPKAEKEPEKKSEPSAGRQPDKKPKPEKEPAKEPDTEISMPEPSAEQPAPQAEPAALPPNVIPFPTPGAPQEPEQQELPMTGTYGGPRRVKEDVQELNIGDPVIIQGNVEFDGKTGDVVGFGRDKHFVIVDLYNFGKHAFHASNVAYNDYADEEQDYIDEGRFKELDIEQQWQAGQQASQNFRNKERTAGEDEPVGDFRVVRRKDGIVSDLKQHHSSNKAFAHAQALKNKYPSMEVGVRWPTGQINWVGITKEDLDEMQTKIDRYNSSRPILPSGAAKIKYAQDNNMYDDARVQEALSDKAMAVLRGLKAPAQAQTAEPVSAEKQAELDAWAQDFQKNVADRYGKQVVAPKPQIDLNVPAKAEPEMDLATVQKKIAQLDELIKLKELIDKLFLKAQKVRGGIHRGLQSDIENEELYGVPQNDREFETLRDKYTKDLKALQQFLAMKKIAWKESVERLSESTALVRLQQARQKLSSQSSLKESLRPGEYHVATVTLDNGDVRKFKVTFDEGYTEAIKKFYARQGRTVKNIDMDWSVQGDFYEETDKSGSPMYRREEVYMVVHNGKEVAFYKPANMKQAYNDAEELVNKFGGEAHVKKVMREAQTDYQKRRQRERDIDAGKPVPKQRQPKMTDYQKRRAQQKKELELGEDQLDEKQDACYNKVKSRYKVWPSAYASGALVQCRKKGADNWGNGGKKK